MIEDLLHEAVLAAESLDRLSVVAASLAVTLVVSAVWKHRARSRQHRFHRQTDRSRRQLERLRDWGA